MSKGERTTLRRPPRLALWVLERGLDGPSREVIIGDLLERYRREPEQGEPPRSQWWFWRESISALTARRVSSRRSRENSTAARRGRSGRSAALAVDLRFAVRVLRRSPTFTLACLLTLALGMGANTAVFTLVDQILVSPLPFPDPERLVQIGETEERLEGIDAEGLAKGNVGYATYEDWRDRSRSFEHMVAMRSWNPTLRRDAESERLSGLRVTWNFFDALGIQPVLGRTFELAEDKPEVNRVAVLSHDLWQRLYGGDIDVLGRTITLNDYEYRVIGVMPANFEPLVSERFFSRAVLWAPMGYDSTLSWACRSCQHLKAFARVREGVTLEQADTELASVHRQVRAENAGEYDDLEAGVVSLRQVLVGDVSPLLMLLLAAVALVLLAACANVANLILAQSAQRRGEMALRSALGASRGDLTRQLAVESGLLSFGGALLGLLVATVLLRLVPALAPSDLPRWQADSAMPLADPRVLLFTFGLMAATGALFTLTPVLGRSRLVSPTTTLRGSSRPLARMTLVTVNVSLAVCLLLGAGLLVRSLDRLMTSNPGFERQGVLSLQFALASQRFQEDSARNVEYVDRLVEQVEALPGVSSAAVAGQIPLGGNYDAWGVRVRGSDRAEADLQRYGVSGDFFAAMGIPLLRGRVFGSQDRADSEPVILVNERAAEELWPGRDPIGQSLELSDEWRTVVGVVGNTRHGSLEEPHQLQMYTPHRQIVDGFLTLVVRTEGEPESLAPVVRGTIRELGSDVPIWNVTTLESLASSSVASDRFLASLFVAFAVGVLLLTAIGLYGLVAYLVGIRRREVGVRLALGAQLSDIRTLFLRQGLAPVAAGLVVGLFGSLVVGRTLRSFLYEVSPFDPWVYGAVVAMLLGVAYLAIGVPLSRAAGIRPAETLRHE